MDTDMDFLADFRAKILMRKSACLALRQSACHGAHGRPTAAARSARRIVGGLLSDASISSRGCPLGRRTCTCVRVLYIINYSVHVYKITR